MSKRITVRATADNYPEATEKLAKEANRVGTPITSTFDYARDPETGTIAVMVEVEVTDES
jgi:hypothetical protein